MSVSLTTQSNQDALAVILPQPVTVEIPRADGTVEKLQIMPIPFRKWRIAFRYIAQIAPLLGFDLETVNLDALETLNKLEIDTGILFRAMQSSNADIIYEFLAFAINKFQPDGITPDISFFGDDMYEQAIDIAVAVVTQNISFFVHRLLPKLVNGTSALRDNLASVRSSLPA